MYKRTPTDTPRAPSKKTGPIRTGATLLCLGLGLSLASCQSYEPKPLDTAAHLEAWRARDLDPSSLQASLEAAHSALPLTTGAFDSSDGLTLEEGRLAALAYNPSLRIARLEIERARASAAHLGLLEDPEFSAKLSLRKEFYDTKYENPKIAAEIEMAIRSKAGLISKKIEENPTVEKTNTDKKD